MTKIKTNETDLGNGHWISAILKDNVGKIIFRIMGILISLFFLILIILTCFGKHINILGIEVNIPTTSNTPAIKDSVPPGQNILQTNNTNENTNTQNVVNKPIINIPPHSNSTTAQTGTKSKVNMEKPVFNGPTQVGDNNTQNIQQGIKQRYVSGEELNDIVNLIPNKTIPIYFISFNAGVEGERYATQIANALKRMGYNIIDGMRSGQMFSSSPIQGNYMVTHNTDNTECDIEIFPAKNIE